MPPRHGGSFWKNAKTYRRFNCRRMATCPCASMPWTWNSDLAISRPIVVIVCMLASSKLWGLNSTHIHGTHVPVEEPSTASEADIRLTITSLIKMIETANCGGLFFLVRFGEFGAITKRKITYKIFRTFRIDGFL